MSYILRTRAVTTWPRCPFSGTYPRIGDKVINITKDMLIEYARFLSEQKAISRLRGTPLIAAILGYIVSTDDISSLALAKFVSIQTTTRTGRITKKPLRLGDEQFIPGGSHANEIDQYDRGYDRGQHCDTETGSWGVLGFVRPEDTIYEEGDIVDDDEPLETYEGSEGEEAEWISDDDDDDDDEESDNEWGSSGSDDDDGASDDDCKYNAYSDGF